MPIQLSIEGVVKRYKPGDEPALKGVSFTIHQGEFFGLLGPNGCGKTTLISIIAGLLKATAGQVTFACDGEPQSLRQVKSLIGLVPQEIALYPTLTITENLRFLGHLYGLHGDKLQERVERCIEIAHLGKFTKRRIADYSGGMRRRANLVTGILHEPKLLFLDEPAVNVDAQSRAVIFDILEQLNADGTTMVYTTHYMQEASAQCHRIAIMDKGEILQIGSPAELVSQTEGANDLNDVFMLLTGRELRD